MCRLGNTTVTPIRAMAWMARVLFPVLKNTYFSFSTTFRQAPGSTQPPIQWVLGGAISPGVMQPGCDADYSLISSAEIMHGGAIPPYVFMA
jgi:hypothetical protein